MAWKATIWVDKGFIKLRAPYDKFRTPDFNADLKRKLPKGTRRWDAEGLIGGTAKVWVIDPAYDEELMEVLNAHYDEVAVLTPEEPALPPPPTHALTAGDPYATMLRLAPDKALHKVYRTIAAALHPDAGGSSDDFTRLGAAWEAVKADRGI